MFDIKFFILNIFISLVFHSTKISCTILSYNEIYNDYDTTLQAQKSIPENVYNSAELETPASFLNSDNNNNYNSNNDNNNGNVKNDDSKSKNQNVKEDDQRDFDEKKFNSGDLYPDYSILNGRSRVQENTEQQQQHQESSITTTSIYESTNNNENGGEVKKDESNHNADSPDGDLNSEEEANSPNRFESVENLQVDEIKLPDEEFLPSHREKIQSNFDKHKFHLRRANNANTLNSNDDTNNKNRKTLKFRDFDSYLKQNQRTIAESKDDSISKYSSNNDNLQPNYNQHQSQKENKGIKNVQTPTWDEDDQIPPERDDNKEKDVDTIISHPKSVKSHNKYESINHHRQHHYHQNHQHPHHHRQHHSNHHQHHHQHHHLEHQYAAAENLHYQPNNLQHHHHHQHHQYHHNINKMKHHTRKWPNLSRSQYQLPSEKNYYVDHLPPYIKKYNRRTKQLQELLQGRVPTEQSVLTAQLQGQQQHKQRKHVKQTETKSPSSTSFLYSSSMQRTTAKPFLSISSSQSSSSSSASSRKKIKNERIHRNHNKNSKWTIEDLFEEQRANPNTPNTNSDDDDQYMNDSATSAHLNKNENSNSTDNGQNQTITTTAVTTTTTDSNRNNAPNHKIQQKEMLKTNELPFDDNNNIDSDDDDDDDDEDDTDTDFSQENSIEYGNGGEAVNFQRDKNLNSYAKNLQSIDNSNSNSKAKPLSAVNNRISSSSINNLNNNNNNNYKFSNRTNDSSAMLSDQNTNSNADDNNNKWSSQTNSFIYHRVEAPRMVGIGDIGKKQRLPFVAITDRKLELSKMQQQRNRKINMYEQNHFPMP